MADAANLPPDPVTLASQARGHADIADYEKARQSMAAAIDLAPNDPELHAAMAWYTYRCRSLDGPERERLAQHHLNVSFEIVPENPHAHYYRGRIFAEQGNAVRARAAFESALKAHPGFELARQAIDRLEGKGPSPSSMVLPVQRKPKVPLVLIFAAVLAALAGAVGYLVLTADMREHAAFGKALGTKLPVGSVSKSQTDLHIDVGPSWKTLSRAEQDNEMRTIAEGAKKKGFDNVYVYSNTEPVAESLNGKVCVDETCRPVMIVEPKPGGGERIKVQVPTEPAKK